MHITNISEAFHVMKRNQKGLALGLASFISSGQNEQRPRTNNKGGVKKKRFLASCCSMPFTAYASLHHEMEVASRRRSDAAQWVVEIQRLAASKVSSSKVWPC